MTTFAREWAMPSGDTFSVPPIRAFVERWVAGAAVVVDPFARNSRLATHRNDLDPDTQAESHMDAEAFCLELALKRVVADVAIFDPPYSPRQISELYQRVKGRVTSRDTQNGALYSRVGAALAELIRPGGIALSFGWNTAGIGKWTILEVLLVAHGGAHNDTICIAQRKPHQLTLVPPPPAENGQRRSSK